MPSARPSTLDKNSFKTRLINNLERRIRLFRDQFFRNYKLEKLPGEIFSQDLQKYSISFCTTCMNRLFHLKETLEKNILDNKNYPNVEFVLINYNSQDGLDEWVEKHFGKYIEEGIFNYYRTNEPPRFHASKAKNLAHKVAKGEILCNLDGDNFTGKDYAFYINYLVNKYGSDTLFHFKKAPYWGTEGRIVISRENLYKLGGYDEDLLPIGHEDHDLINRAKAMGIDYKNIQIENFLRYLSNSTLEKSVNVEDEPSNYYVYESENRKKSNNNIRNRKLVANLDGWGQLPMERNFDNNFKIY